MEYGFSLQTGSPFRGRKLQLLTDFLAGCGLTYDYGIEYTVLITNIDNKIIATASLQESVIKCIAIEPSAQGSGLTATLLTEIRKEALLRGHKHLFLYTKPENRILFAPLGFYPIAAVKDVLLMEDRPNGFTQWIQSIRSPDASGKIGSIVMNCNPMTNGHLHLIRTAAQQCDHLYVFILSEEKSFVPAADRKQIVRQVLSEYPNITVVGTDRYLISSATFPDYFLKKELSVTDVWCALDIAVFIRTANALGISCRFTGTEPFSPVTAAYNQAMAAQLPGHGIEYIEIPRYCINDLPVSASHVRALIQNGMLEAIRPLVPDATFDYFLQHYKS